MAGSKEVIVSTMKRRESQAWGYELSLEETQQAMAEMVAAMIEGWENGFMIAFVDPNHPEGSFVGYTSDSKQAPNSQELDSFAMRVLRLTLDQWRDPRFDLAWIKTGANGPATICFPLRSDLNQ